MKRLRRQLLTLVFAVLLLAGCGLGPAGSNLRPSSAAENVTSDDQGKTDADQISEDGEYTAKDQVALYIHTYGKLPSNYLTKQEAQDLGWSAKEGNLWEVAPNASIGGSYFGNYEGELPKAKGRKYFECDIDYDGGYRNAKRLIYSNDGLIFYTEDHYKTFEQLY
jgi:ribonuclease T1